MLKDTKYNFNTYIISGVIAVKQFNIVLPQESHQSLMLVMKTNSNLSNAK